MSQTIRVRVFPFRKGVGYGNIMWTQKHPMRSGKFPPSHPVGGGCNFSTGEYGDSAEMRDFRSRGYWASCFPEGDGITWAPRQVQSDAKCLSDIREAFGWDANFASGVLEEMPS